MTNRGFIRCVLAVSAALALLAPTIAPAAADAELADYSRTQWTTADGAPPGIVTIAQTPDGWLWLGTKDGLYRFDGVRFDRYTMPAQLGLSRDRINLIRTAPNGDLYISYAVDGLAVLRSNGSFEKIPTRAVVRNSVNEMMVDTDGSLWVIGGGIQRYRQGKWDVIEDGPEWASNNGASMRLDQQGQLWAANPAGAYLLDRKTGRFQKVANGPGELAIAPGGDVWQVGSKYAIRLLSKAPATRTTAQPSVEGSIGGVFDSDGALWLLDCSALVCKVDIGDKAVARNVEVRHLSGAEPQTIFEDREKNIWISTENGIDRLRRNRLLRSGLPGAGSKYSLAKDDAGSVWAADKTNGALWRLNSDGPPVLARREPVTLVANGRDGAMLIGDKRGIERLKQGRSEVIPLPPGDGGKSFDHHMVGILDDGKVLWTTTMETGLIGWRDAKWLPAAAFNLPKKIFQSGPAGAGQLWLATGDGTLVFYDNDKLTTYDIQSLGMASGVFLSGEPLVSGTDAAGVFKDHQVVQINAGNPSVLRNVSGIAITKDGDRWLNGAAGLVHVRAKDWDSALKDPKQPLRYELFGGVDGYPGSAALDNRWATAMTADGRNIWLICTGGIVRLDTAGLQRNSAIPNPVVLSLSTDQAVYPAAQHLSLPPGSSQVRIDFTAPLLRAPEAVRFEYVLDGVDAHWKNSGGRRSASYTNLGPGDYVFRLRAFNEDGVASAQDITMGLTIEPTLTQSFWFKLCGALACAVVLFILYHYRVRYLTRRATEKLEVRTAERERIAIELHDTVLQSMHGVILSAENAAARIHDDPDVKSSLAKAIENANNAIIEGRDRVQSLRHGSEEELIDMFDALVGSEARGRPVDVRQVGVSHDLHWVTKDEMFVIGREAIRNALLHAQASRIEVTLAYKPKELILEISDDGVGMPPEVLAAGERPGHFGLKAMCRRAEQLGGKCSIESQPGRTTVRVSVPARVAYFTGNPVR